MAADGEMSREMTLPAADAAAANPEIPPVAARETGSRPGRAPERLPEEAIAVRACELGDYDDVVAVWRQAGLPFRPRGRDSRQAVATGLERGGSIFLLAEATVGARPLVVGVVLATHDGRKGWINRLAVLPAFQGQGIARRLVMEAEEGLRAQGIDVVAALIESANTGSLSFFSHLGYLHDADIEYFSKRRDPES